MIWYIVVMCRDYKNTGLQFFGPGELGLLSFLFSGLSALQILLSGLVEPYTFIGPTLEHFATQTMYQILKFKL